MSQRSNYHSLLDSACYKTKVIMKLYFAFILVLISYVAATPIAQKDVPAMSGTHSLKSKVFFQYLYFHFDINVHIILDSNRYFHWHVSSIR